MIRKERDGVVWLEFEKLQPFPDLHHALFLRNGGLDFADLTSEVAATVRQIVRGEHLVWATQVHGNRVCLVDRTTQGGELECDAIVTEDPDVALLVRHADCQPALFYDSVHHVVANVHSGWRGNVQNIYKETISMMKKRFGTSPERLLVCIGPSLGPDHAEFLHYKEEFPQKFWKHQPLPFHFNLWEVAREQLLDAGVPEGQIEMAQMDTFANEADFYSYRRGRESGRNATVVSLSKTT